MIINFIGNFTLGYSGEIADETHIARSLEELGHHVQRVPRDIWREFCNGENNPDWIKQLPIGKADINLIAKWDHFENGEYITKLRSYTNAPVFYWVWDSVDLDISWHKDMAYEADLYLSGELGRATEMKQAGIRFYYFQFDCVDDKIKTFSNLDKIYNVSYLGSCDNQRGRIDLLKAINEKIVITVWGNPVESWRKEGFIANEPVYGEAANKVISQSKIVLGTSCDPNLFGYWSNRVGRVIKAGGLLLQQYAPGMESFMHDYIEYFSSPEEACEKIDKIMNNFYLRRTNLSVNHVWTSGQKAIDLTILIERYLKSDHGKDWKLP